MKTILIISAGIEAIFGIQKAKELGYFVVAADGNPNAPGFKYSDDKIICSTYDIEKMLIEVEKYNNSKRKIDGVICIASDVPKTVAEIAYKFGLISVSKKVAYLCTDKFEMKKFFNLNGIPVPWFKEIKSLDDLQNVLNENNSQYVLKPVDSRGARGVLKISGQSNLKKAFDESISYSQLRKLILEKFIPGPQLSSESIIIDKKIFSIAFADRNYEYLEKYSPNIIENGGEMPSKLSSSIIDKIKLLLENVAKVLDIENGILKGDIVIDNEEPLIIEVAPRLSGGYFSTHEIPLSTGIDLIGLAIKQAMGDLDKKISIKPLKNKPIVQRYWFPKEGTVKSISNFQHLRDLKNVEYLEMRVKIGDKIGRIDSHPSRPGLVITSGEDVMSAKYLAEQIIKQVNIVVE